MAYFTAHLPGTGGLAKTAPEDFVVEEIPTYAPSGEGSHLFVTVEKRGLTTQEMVRRVARALGVAPGDIGTAGQKDRQAVTRQVISVPNVDPERALALALDGIRVLAATRHGHKLRTGHLRENRFTITLRGVVADGEARARAILDALTASWLPNRFGGQRFGAHGDNAVLGRALLRGERRETDRFRRRFLLSAYQSLLFNRYLERRLDENLLHRVLAGDVLSRTESGGLFRCADPQVDQPRLDRREVVPSGPIFGHEMFAPTEGSPAATRETAILDEEGLSVERFARFGKLAEGTRRALLVPIEGASVEKTHDALVLRFALPPGSYATVLLDEVMKSDSPTRPEDESAEG